MFPARRLRLDFPAIGAQETSRRNEDRARIQKGDVSPILEAIGKDLKRDTSELLNDKVIGHYEITRTRVFQFLCTLLYTRYDKCPIPVKLEGIDALLRLHTAFTY